MQLSTLVCITSATNDIAPSSSFPTYCMLIPSTFLYCFSLVAHDDYEVGDTVAECNFDKSGGLAMETCCDKFDVIRGFNKPPLHFSSSSESSDTGPSQDHTPDTGMRKNFNEVKMMTVSCVIQIYKLIK